MPAAAASARAVAISTAASHTPTALAAYSSSPNFAFFPPRAFNHKFKLPPDKKFLINIGSVGQPRDRDPRSCYVTFDGEVVEFHRLDYDFRKTMKKILDAKMIPRRFAERLELGK